MAEITLAQQKINGGAPYNQKQSSSYVKPGDYSVFTQKFIAKEQALEWLTPQSPLLAALADLVTEEFTQDKKYTRSVDIDSDAISEDESTHNLYDADEYAVAGSRDLIYILPYYCKIARKFSIEDLQIGKKDDAWVEQQIEYEYQKQGQRVTNALKNQILNGSYQMQTIGASNDGIDAVNTVSVPNAIKLNVTRSPNNSTSPVPTYTMNCQMTLTLTVDTQDMTTVKDTKNFDIKINFSLFGQDFKYAKVIDGKCLTYFNGFEIEIQGMAINDATTPTTIVTTDLSVWLNEDKITGTVSGLVDTLTWNLYTVPTGTGGAGLAAYDLMVQVENINEKLGNPSSVTKVIIVNPDFAADLIMDMKFNGSDPAKDQSMFTGEIGNIEGMGKAIKDTYLGNEIFFILVNKDPQRINIQINTGKKLQNNPGAGQFEGITYVENNLRMGICPTNPQLIFIGNNVPA